MICIAEDRTAEEVGLRLLIRSLATWCPDEQVMLWFPCAGTAFRSWLRDYPQVALMPGRLEGAEGWNVKPRALLAALQRGAAEAWWIDSDVIVTRNFQHDYAAIPAPDFIVAEEALYGSRERNGERASAWGYAVERVLPFCLNSGVMRATAAHIPMLTHWDEQLASPSYLRAQTMAVSDRPAHLFGDQDALTACLSGPFADVPLKYLLRGRDIIQYFGPAGYTPRERARNLLFGLPNFIHSMGSSKPWRVMSSGQGANGWFTATYAELSPYKAVARRFKVEYDGSPWVSNRPPVGTRWLRVMGMGVTPLTGLPLAMAYSLTRIGKRIAASGRNALARLQP